MLAHKPSAFVESVLSGPLKRFTSKTIVSQAALEEGVRCLAVSIFNRRRQCVGTLSVSGPTTRLTTERVAKLAPSARLVADELSRQLGFDTEPAG